MHVVGPALKFPGMSITLEPWADVDFSNRAQNIFLIWKKFPNILSEINWGNAAACMSLSSKASLNRKPSVYTLLIRDILAHRHNVPVMVWWYGSSRQCCWTEPSWRSWGRPSSPKTQPWRSRPTRTPGTAGGTSTESTAPLSSRSPQPSGSGTKPMQKKARLETTYEHGTGSIPPK